VRQFGPDQTAPRLLAAASEGVALGVLAAGFLAGSEIFLNRHLSHEMLFLAVLTFCGMAGPGATIGCLASTAMAAALARLRAKGGRAAPIGVFVFGLLAIGMGWVGATHWREHMFPPATPGTITWWKATAVLAAVVGTGGGCFSSALPMLCESMAGARLR
jgi:hypothetical protein